MSLGTHEKGLKTITDWINKVLKGEAPLPARDTRVVGIPKKTASSKPEDMRILGMMNSDAKLIEAAISQIIRTKCNDLKKFHKNQAGFTERRGTLEQCLKLRLRAERTQMLGKTYHAVTLDIRKAFDSVPIQLVLDVLDRKANESKTDRSMSKEISDFIANWMEQKPGHGTVYASDGQIQGRFQYGRGVPQGGILSPWLFNLVIDELLKALDANKLQADILAFADDICVGGSSSTYVQESINFIENWLNTSGMKLAENKCEHLCFGNDHTDIFVGSKLIEKVDGLTYLGLNFTKSMSFTKEVAEDDYLQAIYAKYSGTSPLQTARTIRAIRWSKILYGSEIFFPTQELLTSEQRKFDKAVFKQSKYMHCHLVEQEAGTNFILEADHAIRVANFLRKIVKQGECEELQYEVQRIKEGQLSQSPYLKEVGSMFKKHNVDLLDLLSAPTEDFWEIKAKIYGSIQIGRAAEVRQKSKRHVWRKLDVDWGRIGRMSKAYSFQDSRCLFMFRLPSFSIECLKEQSEVVNKEEDRCIYCNQPNSNNGAHIAQTCGQLPRELDLERTEILLNIPKEAILPEDAQLRRANAGKQEIQKVLSWMKNVLVESATRTETKKKISRERSVISDQKSEIPPKSQGLEETIRMLQKERLPEEQKIQEDSIPVRSPLPLPRSPIFRRQSLPSPQSAGGGATTSKILSAAAMFLETNR
eukprot:GHVP01058127.1.p1 GENE.GHVP01058127.1~~GHVP01058127.1.p1  ORF type:complete len:701 (-),score=118.99 GHVP01058127.1:3-2105(-)